MASLPPQIEQGIQKVDDFLAAYPNVTQYEKLRELEKKTGQPKVYFFLLIVSVIVSVIYGTGGMKLVSDLIGFAYPAYMSLIAIDTAETTDDTQWLTYWVVFALFSIMENVMTFLVNVIPFYYLIKISFFAWLFHPKFMGAGLVYKKVVKPYVMPHVQAIAEQSKPQKKEE